LISCDSFQDSHSQEFKQKQTCRASFEMQEIKTGQFFADFTKVFWSVEDGSGNCYSTDTA
jgi:hypothetical protein